MQRSVLDGLDELLHGLSGNPPGTAEQIAAAEEIPLLQQAVGEWLLQQESLAQAVNQLDDALGENARRELAAQQHELADAVQGRARRPATPEACRLGLERAGRPMSDAAALLEQGPDRSPRRGIAARSIAAVAVAAGRARRGACSGGDPTRRVE